MVKYTNPLRPKKVGDEFYVPCVYRKLKCQSFSPCLTFHKEYETLTAAVVDCVAVNAQDQAFDLNRAHKLVGCTEQVLLVMWKLKKGKSGDILRRLEYVSESAGRASICALVRWGFLRAEKIKGSKQNTYFLV